MKNNPVEKRIKALWLPSWYPSREHPFLGSFTRRDAEAVSAFCDLKILYAVESKVAKYELEVEKRPQGFEEVRVYFPETNNRWLKLWRYLTACRRGFGFMKNQGFKPDVLHVHVSWHAGLAGLYFERQLDLPVLVTEHWSGYHLGETAFRGIQGYFGRYFAKKARVILTVSEGQAKAMQRLGLTGNYQTIPNVVDTENLPQKLPVGSSRICKFIHVSSFHDEQKNISGMLRSFSNLAKQRQDFSLTLVGGLDHVTNFGKLSADLGISKFVHFTGMLEHDEVMKLLATHNVFVLFSNQEGLPCSMLEAMAVGLPVISTAIEGLEKWVTEDTGLLVPIGDEDALLKALLDMLDSHQNYSPEKISEFIANRCSYQAVGQQVAEAYSKL